MRQPPANVPLQLALASVLTAAVDSQDRTGLLAAVMDRRHTDHGPAASLDTPSPSRAVPNLAVANCTAPSRAGSGRRAGRAPDAAPGRRITGGQVLVFPRPRSPLDDEPPAA